MRAADYQAQLNALLPPGPLWEALRQDDNAQALLLALADEFARIDGRAANLLTETDPRLAWELLAEWEAWAGLPSTCAPAEQSISARQAALHTHLNFQGGQSRAYFVALAANLGHEITILEHGPRRHGDPLGGEYGTDEWRFVWSVVAAAGKIIYRLSGGGLGEHYARWGNEQLECAMRRFAPAHTSIRFIYE